MIKTLVDDTQNTYKDHFNTVAGKYYAHREIRNDQQRFEEFEGLKIGIEDIEKLIVAAKDTIRKRLFFWEEREANFEESHYSYFRDKFWHSINPDIFHSR